MVHESASPRPDVLGDGSVAALGEVAGQSAGVDVLVEGVDEGEGSAGRFFGGGVLLTSRCCRSRAQLRAARERLQTVEGFQAFMVLVSEPSGCPERSQSSGPREAPRSCYGWPVSELRGAVAVPVLELSWVDVCVDVEFVPEGVDVVVELVFALAELDVD